MKKRALIGLSLFLAIGCFAYLFLYKGHRDIDTETANYVVTISGLEKNLPLMIVWLMLNIRMKQ